MFVVIQLVIFSCSSFRLRPCCSELTMSLVNAPLKLRSLNMAYTLLLLLKKMWIAFAFARTTQMFFSKKKKKTTKKKNCELDIVLTRTVKILTTDELVKLSQRCFEQLSPDCHWVIRFTVMLFWCGRGFYADRKMHLYQDMYVYYFPHWTMTYIFKEIGDMRNILNKKK